MTRSFLFDLPEQDFFKTVQYAPELIRVVRRWCLLNVLEELVVSVETRVIRLTTICAMQGVVAHHRVSACVTLDVRQTPLIRP